MHSYLKRQLPPDKVNKLTKLQTVTSDSMPGKAEGISYSSDFINNKQIRWPSSNHNSESSKHNLFPTHFSHDYARANSKGIAPVSLQPKLTINQPNDEYEQEADAVADKIMHADTVSVRKSFLSKTPQPSARRACAQCDEAELKSGEHDHEEEPEESGVEKSIAIQEKCAACDDEEKKKKLYRKESADPSSPKVFSAVEQTLASAGQELDKDTRFFMERKFSYDFRNVKIHNDALAHQSSRDIQAKAYTYQNHIAFGNGQYQPGTDEGKKLLAHELTHVVQQENGLQLKSIQRQPDSEDACRTGKREGEGENVDPGNSNIVYAIWGTWDGSSIESNIRRIFPLWLDYRYGDKITPGNKAWILNNYLTHTFPDESRLKVGCQYKFFLTLDVYATYNALSLENTESGREASRIVKDKKFDKIKSADKEKIWHLLQDWLSEPEKQKTEDTSDKKEDPDPDLTDADLKALVTLANNPNKNTIIQKLKQAAKGKDKKVTLEQLLADFSINEAAGRLDESLSGDRPEPVERRPVRGQIAYQDPDIVPDKEVAFYFEVQDDRDALRVPWINIRWHASSDPLEKHSDTYKKFMFTPKTSSLYSPIKEQTNLNDKFFKVKFPEKGTYIVEALVNHNYFLPNVFYRRVPVSGENELWKKNENEVYKGFAIGGTTESEYKFEDASNPYDTGTRTVGRIDNSFRDMAWEDKLKSLQAEKEAIGNLLAAYKTKDSSEAKAIVDWTEAYLTELSDYIGKVEAEGKTAGTTAVPCKGVYVSRTTGVPTGELKLSCFIRKTTVHQPGKTKEGDEKDPVGHSEYEIVLLDSTQLYEHKNYIKKTTRRTPDAAMEAAFIEHASHYPNGSMSIAFQRYDEKTGKLTSEFVKYGKNTDTVSKDIKVILFNEAVSDTVFVVSTLLALFPPTTGIGVSIGIIYNTASTLSELEEAESKGILTRKKEWVGLASIAIDLIPIAGAALQAKRLLSIGNKTYIVLDKSSQFAGMTYIGYEKAAEQIAQIRSGIVKELSDINEKLKTANPADPQFKVLQEKQQKLIKQGQEVAAEIFTEAAGEMGLMLVGMHMLQKGTQRIIGAGKAELQERGLFEQEGGKKLHYDYESGKIKGDGNQATRQEFTLREREAYYDHMIAESQEINQSDLSRSAEQRKAVVEKLTLYGDVEIRVNSSETKLIQQGNRRILHIAEGAGLEHVHAAIESSGIKRTSTQTDISYHHFTTVEAPTVAGIRGDRYRMGNIRLDRNSNTIEGGLSPSNILNEIKKLKEFNGGSLEKPFAMGPPESVLGAPKTQLKSSLIVPLPGGKEKKMDVVIWAKDEKGLSSPQAHTSKKDQPGPARLILTSTGSGADKQWNIRIEVNNRLQQDEVKFLIEHEMNEVVELFRRYPDLTRANIKAEMEASLFRQGSSSIKFTAHDKAAMFELLSLYEDLNNLRSKQREAQKTLREATEKEDIAKRAGDIKTANEQAAIIVESTQDAMAFKAKILSREGGIESQMVWMGLSGDSTQIQYKIKAFRDVQEELRVSIKDIQARTDFAKNVKDEKIKKANSRIQNIEVAIVEVQSNLARIELIKAGKAHLTGTDASFFNVVTVRHLLFTDHPKGSFITNGMYGGHYTSALLDFIKVNPQYAIVERSGYPKTGADGNVVHSFEQYLWTGSGKPPAKGEPGYPVAEGVDVAGWERSKQPKTTADNLTLYLSDIGNAWDAWRVDNSWAPTDLAFDHTKTVNLKTAAGFDVELRFRYTPPDTWEVVTAYVK